MACGGDQEELVVEVGRGFYRGEFAPPSTPKVNSFQTHDDTVFRHTLVIGPAVLKQFLGRVGGPGIGAVHFAKLFANLRLDWQEERFGELYYFLQPYKYGPIPVVPQRTPSGDYLRLQEFLCGKKCLIENRKQHGSAVRRSFSPNEDSCFPWQAIYDRSIDGSTKAHIGGLVRLYAAIHSRCKTARPSGKGASRVSVFQDALVVLASARNQRVAYKCGLFELEDWCGKGERLLQVLKARGRMGGGDNTWRLASTLRSFAEPAALLFDKIEMYRNILYLRRQIEELRDSGDFEMAHAVLETIDKEPSIKDARDFPVGALEWACAIMRSFSSFLRQVLGLCDPDLDRRPSSRRFDAHGNPKDASYYLKELCKSMPELEPLHVDLQDSIKRANQGRLTSEVVEPLSRAFQLILGYFDAGDRIPRYSSERSNTLPKPRGLDLIPRLQDIALPEPYAVAVVDAKNFTGTARYLCTEPGDGVDETAASLHEQLRTSALQVSKMFSDVYFAGYTADAVVLAGPHPETVFQGVLNLMQTTTRIMEEHWNSLPAFGLLKTGIAWHQPDLGTGFRGVEPGTVAYQIGDKGERKPGDVVITDPILQRLSPECGGQFGPVDDGQCEQGQIYVRCWPRDTNASSVMHPDSIGSRSDEQT